MARFYATFDNSTVSALEDPSTTYRFQRKAFTNGSTLKTALVAARLAISDAFYAQIELVNRNGSNGVVLPSNAIGIGGGNLSFTNLYTNPGAAWTSSPRVRPTEQILTGSAGTNPVSPTDGGSISASLYTDAATALGNALAGIADGGPNGRLGLNQWRTLASLWHDGDLSYFAWDDFTPGEPQNILNPANTVSGTATGGNGQVVMQFDWDEEYPADLDGNIVIQGSINGPVAFTKSFYAEVAASLGTTTITVTDIDESGLFDIVGSAQFYDYTITTHAGALASFTFNDAFTIPLT
jgi:hypothetical protein